MKHLSRSCHLVTTATICALLLAGCGAENSNPASGGPHGLAILRSDHQSIALALLDPTTGMVTRPDCTNSGSTAPTLTQAFSGDVTLPSQPQPGGLVALIDRGQATLTWIDPTTCLAVRQMSVSGGFAANPQDLIAVSATKAYVPRFGSDAASGAGNDLLIIDPSQGMAAGTIALGSYALPGPDGTAVLPRPNRGIYLNGKVYLTLNNLSGDFAATGLGRIVVIDPSTDQVTGTIDPPGLKNCGVVAEVPGSQSFAVGCVGAYSDGTAQIDGSGVAWIDVSAAPPKVTIVKGAQFGRPPSNTSLAVASANAAFTTTDGIIKAPPPDQLWAFSFSHPTAKKFYDASGGYVLSGLAYDAGAKRLYATDAGKDAKLLIFDASNPAAPILKTSLTVGALGDLPPRELSWY